MAAVDAVEDAKREGSRPAAAARCNSSRANAVLKNDSLRVVAAASVTVPRAQLRVGGRAYAPGSAADGGSANETDICWLEMGRNSTNISP